MSNANPFKSGSRKAMIYDAYKTAKDPEAGLKAAFFIAKREGIKPGTVKSWASQWSKDDPEKKKPKAERPAKVEKVAKVPTTSAILDKSSHPLFKYATRQKADKAHEDLCTRSGLRPHAFHVIEDEGRFAVAPANYKPGGPIPKFEVGDIVYDALIINSKAKVVSAGSEQSVVRYVKDRPSRPREDCILNRFLVKLPEAAKPDNKKLQKAAEASGALALGKSSKVKREKL